MTREGERGTDSLKSDFSQGSIPKNILRLALPMLAAELVNVLYNLVDRMYLGHIAGTGTSALTGVGVVLPIITIITAFAQLCGTGGAPLFSIARGERDEAGAQAIQENAFTLLLVFSAALTVLLYAVKRPVLLLFGASADTLPFALDYLNIYLAGTAFTSISLGMNPFINAQGFGRVGMGTVLLGAAANIVLDPVFIFTLKMGVKGAALATVLSQLLSAAWVLLFLTGKKCVLPLTRLRLERAQVRRIAALGVTGFVFKITNSVTQAVINAVLQARGGAQGDLYVGAMTIINSLREVISLPISSVTGAALPVMSFNYGAHCNDRVRRSILFVLQTSLGYNLCAWAAVMLAPAALMRIFTDDAALIALGSPCIRIYFAAYFLMSLQLTGQNTFIALNKPKYAVFFSLFRKAALVLPLTLLLPFTRLGVNGVFYAETISQLVGATACFSTMMLTVWRGLRAPEAG